MNGSRAVAGAAVVVGVCAAVGLGTLVLVNYTLGEPAVVTLSHQDVLAQLSGATREPTGAAQPNPSPSPSSHSVSSRSSHSPSSHEDKSTESPTPLHSPSEHSGSEATSSASSHQVTRSSSSPTPTPTPTQSSAEPSHTPSSKPSSSPPPSPSSAPTSTTGSITKLLSSQGGSVVARCDAAGENASVYLVSWSPAQGYAAHEVRRGPAHEAELSFDSDSTSVSVSIQCGADGPVEEVEVESNDG